MITDLLNGKIKKTEPKSRKKLHKSVYWLMEKRELKRCLTVCFRVKSKANTSINEKKN